MKENEQLRLAMLISGGGSTMESVLNAKEKGELPNILPVVVLSSKEDAKGIQKAQKYDIPTFVVRRKGVSPDYFGDTLLKVLRRFNVDLVSQNGWLPLTPETVISEYQKMIINQHPGPLDPGHSHDFGGKGMYGARVSCARIAYLWMSGEDPQTESTIHFVTKNFDDGDTISVFDVPIPGFDFLIDEADLQKEKYVKELMLRTSVVQSLLLPIEHQNVISVLKRFGLREEINKFSRISPLIPEENYSILETSKSIALKLYPNG